MRAFAGPHGLVALAVLAAPLAIGSAHTATRVALAALVAVALVWSIVVDGRKLRFDTMAWALLVAFAWTLVQWLPMPAEWVEALGSSSTAREAHATALSTAVDGTRARKLGGNPTPLPNPERGRPDTQGAPGAP